MDFAGKTVARLAEYTAEGVAEREPQPTEHGYFASPAYRLHFTDGTWLDITGTAAGAILMPHDIVDR